MTTLPCAVHMQVQATRVGSSTTLSSIARLVQDSQVRFLQVLGKAARRALSRCWARQTVALCAGVGQSSQVCRSQVSGKAGRGTL